MSLKISITAFFILGLLFAFNTDTIAQNSFQSLPGGPRTTISGGIDKQKTTYARPNTKSKKYFMCSGKKKKKFDKPFLKIHASCANFAAYQVKPQIKREKMYRKKYKKA